MPTVPTVPTSQAYAVLCQQADMQSFGGKHICRSAAATRHAALCPMPVLRHKGHKLLSLLAVLQLALEWRPPQPT